MAMKKPVKKAATKPQKRDSDRAYRAAADSMYYSSSPSASTRRATAVKRTKKDDDAEYETKVRALTKKYATPYRGNKVTGFGKTAPRKSDSTAGASQKGGMYKKQTRPDFEYFKQDPKDRRVVAEQRQKNTDRRLNPKKK